MNRYRAFIIGGCVAVLAAAGAAAAGDLWYALYEGDEHRGYCHVVDSSATISGVVCKRTSHVTESHKDKTGKYIFKKTADRYHDANGALLLYSATTTYKGEVTKVSTAMTVRKKFKGITFILTEKAGTKDEKVTTFEVADNTYNLLEVEEARAKVTAPGTRVEALALDLETGKVEKTKLEYVADQTLDVAGTSVPTKVLQAKGGMGSGQWWFNADGVIVKWTASGELGKTTCVMVADAAAATPPAAPAK